MRTERDRSKPWVMRERTLALGASEWGCCHAIGWRWQPACRRSSSFVLVAFSSHTRIWWEDCFFLFYFFYGNQWTVSQLSLSKEVMEGFVLFSFSSFLLSFFFFFFFLLLIFHSFSLFPSSIIFPFAAFFFFLFTDHLAGEVCEIYNSVSSYDCYYSGQYHIMHYAINY